MTLDLTYSAKALAGLRAAGRSGILSGPTLFWNTYNGVDVRETVGTDSNEGRTPVGEADRMLHRTAGLDEVVKTLRRRVAQRRG